MDLHARPGRFGQTPLAAAAPIAIVGIHRTNRRAHRRHFADARLKRSSRWHVDRDCQVHQRDRGQHHRHLADADRAADAAILRRYHQVLHRDWFRHPAPVGLIIRSPIRFTRACSSYAGKRCVVTSLLRRMNSLFYIRSRLK